MDDPPPFAGARTAASRLWPARRRRVPSRLAVGALTIDTGTAAFWLLVALTLAAELATNQRWFHLLGRSIYNPFALEQPSGLALFAAALVTVHAGVLAVARLLLMRIAGRRWGSARAGFNLLFFGLAGWAALLLLRMIAVDYGADLADLDQLRRLAGGHLLSGLAYLRPQALFVLGCAAATALLYAVLRAVLVFDPPEPARPARRRARIAAAGWALAAVALLFRSAGTPDVRDALTRFAAPRLALRVLDGATDFDRDGYGLFSSPPDDAPFDAARHPYALDVPDDGIDQDGLAGDFHYTGLARAATPVPAPFAGRRKHVILVVLESTRADAIGRTWRGAAVTPNLNALAAAGTASTEGYSNQANTGDSMKVIFGGDVPPILGGTVFEDFRRAGYRVGIFSSQSEDWGGTAAALRMRESADIFVDAPTLRATSSGGIGTADGEAVLRAFDARLGRRDLWTVPTFLYFNFQYAHFPYEQPGTLQLLPGRRIAEREIEAGNAALVAGAYWNAVANADRAVGALVARLKALGVWQDSVVAVVGDHGEALFEDGHLGHGLILDARTTRVPFILSVAGFPLPRPVSHADLRAILLRAAGGDVPLPAGGPVFQFLGTLDKPSIIGMAEAGGATTTLSLRDGHVVSTAPAAAAHYASLRAGSWLKARADRVAQLWERARWEHALAARARR